MEEKVEKKIKTYKTLALIFVILGFFALIFAIVKAVKPTTVDNPNAKNADVVVEGRIKQSSGEVEMFGSYYTYTKLTYTLKNKTDEQVKIVPKMDYDIDDFYLTDDNSIYGYEHDYIVLNAGQSQKIVFELRDGYYDLQSATFNNLYLSVNDQSYQVAICTKLVKSSSIVMVVVSFLSAFMLWILAGILAGVQNKLKMKQDNSSQLDNPNHEVKIDFNQTNNTAQTKKCEYCGAKNSSDATKCKNCGAKLK